MRLVRPPQASNPTPVDFAPEVITAWREDVAVPHGPADRRDLHDVKVMTRLTLIVVCFLALLAGLIFVRLNAVAGPGSILAAPDHTYDVQLVAIGPTPAAEVITHIAYADKSEIEANPGRYQITNPAGVMMEVTAGPGETGCRIVVDNVRVAEDVAYDHGTAVCRWTAPTNPLLVTR